ncbi:hypothetical protein C2I36_00095 [Rhodobacteraceae bacterium WD3A24]|nr:hypothetical protein C2I36_00095 [Rhodobacteraceae bacterium WD3A24]
MRSDFSMTKSYINVPEAVGIFDNKADLQEVIYDLMLAGFSRYDISVLGSQEALESKLGEAFWQAKELEDNPDAPRASFVSEEAVGELEGGVAGGFFFLGSAIAMTVLLGPASSLAASIAAVAIGGTPGAVLGSLLARRVHRHHQEYYENQIKHGGLLVWVRVADKDKEEKAVQLLEGHSGRDVHVHGWSED